MVDAEMGWLAFIQPNGWYTISGLMRRSNVPRPTIRRWLIDKGIQPRHDFRRNSKYLGADILKAFEAAPEPVADERAALAAAK